MSRTIPTNIATHLTGDVTTMVACWAVTRRDGVVVRGTQHDRDITIASGTFAGTYLSAAGITGSDIHASSDLSPDNSEIEGMIPEDAFLVDLKAADIEAGLFDDAALALFLCNWAAPNDGQVQMPGANLGNIRRTSEGRYTAEVRGLTQRLTQPLLRTYSPTCNADLADTRCGKDISALIVIATVTAVTSRRRFDCSLSRGETAATVSSRIRVAGALNAGSSGVMAGSVELSFRVAGVLPKKAAGAYLYGKVLGLTGLNAGYTREVKQDAVGATLGNLELYELLPLTVAIGDTFSLYPGCDKTLATCKTRFSNLANFRGFGVFTPTANKMIRGPDRGSGPV